MEKDISSNSVVTKASDLLFSTAFTGPGNEDGFFNLNLSGAADFHFSASSGINQGITPFDIGIPLISTSDPVAFNFYGDSLTPPRNKNMIDCDADGDQPPKCSISFINSQKIILPKPEPFDEQLMMDNPIEMCSFRSGSLDQTLPLCDWRFRQLPELRSIEQASNDLGISISSHMQQNELAIVESSSQVNLQSSSSTDSYTLEAIVRNFALPNPSSVAWLQAPKRSPPSSAAVHMSTLARQRRKKIGDRTRCLQKLMPWDKKMSMATLLEEAYKYIEFLKAQLRALQTMPCQSSIEWEVLPGNVGLELGGLEKLNRQQLLQVLVNSPVAQTMLYSKRQCVFSWEQLLLLNKITENKQQTLLLGSSSSSRDP
ncbi:PREDICTED: transcription factor bHLH117 [Nelumbo nucifera]|uniref:BHLH domain-containing protein n=2 Tax=Nelumbo nucifera TaxID=4432 RepID=A0A822XPK7_NELNU|nr:PREDICTED: transcription factor bHLH117 [Nelumbo nucifera]DAD20665.1 TPA_asm: hypothetical protein HUJ06_022128 [Nelumbo nucifera]